MPETHNYRKLKELLKFTGIVRAAKVTDNDLGANDFGRQRLVLCLLPQFTEDTSDPPALPVRQAGGRAGGYSPRQYARENRDLDRRLSKLRAP
ncbi:MAG: hypothetical protein LBD85_06615, partial [Oscillospiraceae bacterium]|nr:hypothetical protein [Oscillospiraceae bacterium]